MAIDPPYRLDPFRNIINIHFEEMIECPPEGEGYPGLQIVAANYGVGAICQFIDFYMAINITGPHASGNPNWPAYLHPASPPALCVDAGVLLEEAIGSDSGVTYVSAVSVSIPYVINPETGGPAPEVFAAMVADDWDNIEDYIQTSISAANLPELLPYAQSAFDAAKQNYYDFIATQPDGQQQSSNDTAQTDIAICGETA